MARQYSVIPDLELPIELGTSGLAAEDPITIGQMLRTTRDSYPDTPALASKEGDEWKKINYKEYYTLSLRAAKSLLKVIIMYICTHSGLYILSPCYAENGSILLLIFF